MDEEQEKYFVLGRRTELEKKKKEEIQMVIMGALTLTLSLIGITITNYFALLITGGMAISWLVSGSYRVGRTSHELNYLPSEGRKL